MRFWTRLPVVALGLMTVLPACKPRDEEPTTAVKADDDLVQETPLDLSLGEFGFDPDQPMSPEAARGLRNVFLGRGFRMLVPETLFTKIFTFEPQRQWNVYGNAPSPPSRQQLGEAANGRTAAGADVGLGFAVFHEGGKRYVNFTCFECHAGVVAGKTVAGLPNTAVDQVALSANLAQFKRVRDFYVNQLGDIGQSLAQALAGLGPTEIEGLMQFTLYSQTILDPLISRARSRGDNWGVFPVWQLLARLRDPAGAGFDLFPLDATEAKLMARERLIRETPLGPVDARPWWVRKHDVKSYVYGDTLTERRAGKDFAINFTVPHAGHNESYKERSQLTGDILQFALESKSPPYPYDESDPRATAATIEEGRGIYNANCARCHGRVEPGTAGKKWKLLYKSVAYAGSHDTWKNTCLPDVLFSTDKDPQGKPVDSAWKADTDLAYSCALLRFNSLAQYASGINPFFAKPGFGIDQGWLPEVYNPAKPGYRAPPLVGIWASAPYLHNGSLPTLGDLFRHESLSEGGEGGPRPLGWSRVLEVSKDLSYDALMVGMQVEPFFEKAKFPKDPGLDYDFKKQVDFRRFYDTTVPGKSGAGAETCGAGLDQTGKQEKDKVLAFLKELTDDNVEADPGKCAHPTKPRVYDDYAAGKKDHPVCKAYYQGIGAATL